MANYNKIIDDLTAAGWKYSHTATFSRYYPAGYVSKMKTRGGVEFCRLHYGRCVGRRGWQITSVYFRECSGNAEG